MNNFTPGPWFPVQDAFWSIEIHDGQRIASLVESEALYVDGTRYPENHSEANAHLISSAPDLLEALQDLVDYVEDMHRIGHIQRPVQASNAVRAILKAKGEEL